MARKAQRFQVDGKVKTHSQLTKAERKSIYAKGGKEAKALRSYENKLRKRYRANLRIEREANSKLAKRGLIGGESLKNIKKEIRKHYKDINKKVTSKSYSVVKRYLEKMSQSGTNVTDELTWVNMRISQGKKVTRRMLEAHLAESKSIRALINTGANIDSLAKDWGFDSEALRSGQNWGTYVNGRFEVDTRGRFFKDVDGHIYELIYVYHGQIDFERVDW